MAQSGGRILKPAAWSIGFVLLAVNATALVNLCSGGPSKFRDMDTYFGLVVGQKMAEVYIDRLDVALEKITRNRHGEYRQQIMRGFADSVASLYWSKYPSIFQKKVNSISEVHKPEIYRAFGRIAFHKYQENLQKCNMLFEKMPESMRRYCYEGIGSALGYQKVTREPAPGCKEAHQFSKEIEHVPSRYVTDCYRGLGSVAILEYDARTHIRMRESIERFNNILNCIQPEYRSNLIEGKNLGYYRFPEW